MSNSPQHPVFSFIILLFMVCFFWSELIDSTTLVRTSHYAHCGTIGTAERSHVLPWQSDRDGGSWILG